MKEYYGKPEATREVIDPEGWFHTGDIGVIEDGIVKITDRKKDIIVNAGGKNIAPQNLENALKATPYISQVMVHGDKRPYLVALITLNEENVAKWARDNGVPFNNVGDLAQSEKVRALLAKYVDELNAKEPSYSSIKKFAVLAARLLARHGRADAYLEGQAQVHQREIQRHHRRVLYELRGVGWRHGGSSIRRWPGCRSGRRSPPRRWRRRLRRRGGSSSRASAFLALVRWTPEELTQRSWLEVMFPEAAERDMVMREVQPLYQTGGVLRHRVAVVCGDGVGRELDLTTTAISLARRHAGPDGHRRRLRAGRPCPSATASAASMSSSKTRPTSCCASTRSPAACSTSTAPSSG